jgi:HSP20 family protein
MSISLFRRDPFFEDFFAPVTAPSHHLRHAPGTHHHLYETDDAIQLSVDVPGVKAKDLKIQVDDNILRVSGERKTAGSESTFTRSFSIDPNTVDVDNLMANLDCGVLNLTAPKRTKPAVTKTITISETPVTDSKNQPSITNK